MSGGQMSGPITYNSDSATLEVTGGKTKGAYLDLRGKDNPNGNGVFVLAGFGDNLYAPLIGTPTGNNAGTLTWCNNDLGGASIVAKSLGTTGYYKRADGLIEQWGQTNNVTRWDFPITFPNAVIGVYAGINYNGEQNGYNAVKTLTTSYLEPTLQNPLVTTYWRVLGY